MTVSNRKNPDAWGTASKLCARKRSELFPVRDNIVRDYLDLTRYKNYRVDWQVFRSLIDNRDITAAIDAAFTQAKSVAGRRRLWMDTSWLRILDAALWTYARELEPVR